MKPLCLASLLCLICLAPASVTAQVPDKKAREASVLFLKKLQTPSGGFLVEPPDPKSNRLNIPTLRATSSAIRAIKYLGGEVPNKDAVVKFVASSFKRDSGGFADTPAGKPDVFTTAVGLMAVTELDMPAEPYHAAALKYLADNVKSFEDVRMAAAGLERIKGKAPKQTEWTAELMKLKLPEKEADGRARMVASKAVTLLRLGVELKEAEDIVKDLKACQRQDGGFGKAESVQSDLESTYRVMRALMMLKAKPANVDALRAYIHKCRNADNGYSVMPGQPSSSVSGTYYAAIITHWLDEMK